MYIVMTRSAAMPSSCWGVYRYLALVELDKAWAKANPGQEPKMISTRARGVKRIVRESVPLHVGATMRSEYRRTMAEYQEQAEKLNAETSR